MLHACNIKLSHLVALQNCPVVFHVNMTTKPPLLVIDEWTSLSAFIKVLGYILFITFNWACTQMTVYGLIFFSTKNLWIWRDLTMYCAMDNAGPDWDILLIISCFNFTEAKSGQVYTVLPDKGLFLKNQMTFATHLALEYVENWQSSIVHCFWLLGWLRFWLKSLVW